MEGPELQPACLDGGVARVRLVLQSLPWWGQHILTEASDSRFRAIPCFLTQIFSVANLKKKKKLHREVMLLVSLGKSILLS